MHRFFAVVALLALAGCAAGPDGLRQSGALASPAVEDRPNVVIFLIDDLGWRDLGFMGRANHETPRLDALAAASLVCTDGYANAPNCAPSRASLMTGRYTPAHGVYTVGSPARGKRRDRRLIPTPNRTTLPTEMLTLAEALRATGYRTAHVGKWHLGEDPCTQGFDVNVAGNRSGSPRGGHFAPYRNPDLDNGPEGESLTRRLTDEAVQFVTDHVARRGRQPFLLHFAHYSVHTPIQGEPDLVAKYRSAGHAQPVYAAMVESVDRSLGRVLDTLDATGVRDDTMVIVMSDNGGYGPITSMAPLRGSKGMLYEGGIRVPLVLHWPGHIEPGTTRTPVMGADLFPTLAAAAGADVRGLDGVDLRPLWRDPAHLLEDRALYWHFPAYLQAYRKNGPSPWRTTPAGAIRHGDWKLLEFFEDGRRELYNLAEDIGEARDLSQAQPEITARLAQDLAAWRARNGAPVPTEPEPRYRPATDR